MKVSTKFLLVALFLSWQQIHAADLGLDVFFFEVDNQNTNPDNTKKLDLIAHVKNREGRCVVDLYNNYEDFEKNFTKNFWGSYQFVSEKRITVPAICYETNSEKSDEWETKIISSDDNEIFIENRKINKKTGLTKVTIISIKSIKEIHNKQHNQGHALH